MAQKPLDGLKVLDFCWVVAGPLTTKYLGEYGATVVRVESSKRPGTLRTGAPFKDGVSGLNRSGYYGNYNVNKHSLTIDMRHPRARDLVLRIAKWADVVTENFTPGTMEDWGLGYEELKNSNPAIIMFSSSSLGRGGPMSGQPGFGPVLGSLAGLTQLTGWPDRDPVNPYGAYTDFIIPRFGVPAILAALDRRRRTGKGIHLDLSQLEASIHFSAPFFLDYVTNGNLRVRDGNRDPAAAPHGAYPCVGEERWIAIACFTDHQWQALRDLVCPDGHGWAHEECFSTFQGRKSHEDELDQRMAEATRGWESKTLMDTLQSVGVPAGVVNDCRDLFEDLQLLHRGHFQYPVHAELGSYAVERSEMDLSRTPGSIDRPAPLLGEHTEYVLRELIGLTEEEFGSLGQDGVLV